MMMTSAFIATPPTQTFPSAEFSSKESLVRSVNEHVLVSVNNKENLFSALS